MRRIAVINQKGGVGKTTTVANLGAALARLGRRVVVVDMDPQANLTLHLGVEPRPGLPSTYTVLTGRASLASTLVGVLHENLRIAPSHIDLAGAELELASTIGRETVLADALDDWERAETEREGRPPADYVLIDCPPSLGLLSVNGLVAATEVVIALQTEFFALQGLSNLLAKVIEPLRKRIKPELEITGILSSLYDSRLRLAREVLAEARQYFPGKVFESKIRLNVKLAEAPSYGCSIFEYAPSSNGAKDYLQLAQELIAQEARDPDLTGRELPAPDPEDVESILSAEPAREDAEVDGPAPRESGREAPPEQEPAAEALPEVDVPRPVEAQPEEAAAVVSEAPVPETAVAPEVTERREAEPLELQPEPPPRPRALPVRDYGYYLGEDRPEQCGQRGPRQQRARNSGSPPLPNSASGA